MPEKFLMVLKVLFFFSLLAFSYELSARSLMAKKSGIEVYDSINKNKSKRKVVHTLKKNEVVTERKRKGMWWEVQLPGGNTGYVSVMMVRPKPRGQSTALSNALRKAVTEGRSTSTSERSRSAVMGIRGLDESKSASAGHVKPDARGVYRMENYTIDKKSVNRIADMVAKEAESLY